MPNDPTAAERSRELLRQRLTTMRENRAANENELQTRGILSQMEEQGIPDDLRAAMLEAARSVPSIQEEFQTRPRAGRMMDRAIERVDGAAIDRAVSRVRGGDRVLVFDADGSVREYTIPREVTNVPIFTLDERDANETETFEQSTARVEAENEQSPSSFVPESALTYGDAELPLDEIEIPDGTPEPTADLLLSVRAFGVFQPIIVQQRETGSYALIDGARRAIAAREAGITSIPAIVFDSDVPPEQLAAVTFSANVARRVNPLRELSAIQAMMGAGASEASIARELGVNRQLIRQRLALGRLVPGLRAALMEGDIGASVAMLASRGDSEQQAAMLAVLARGETLTARTVRQLLARADAPVEQTEVAMGDATVETAPSLTAPSLTAVVHQDDSISLSDGSTGWLVRRAQANMMRAVDQARAEMQFNFNEAEGWLLYQGRRYSRVREIEVNGIIEIGRARYYAQSLYEEAATAQTQAVRACQATIDDLRGRLEQITTAQPAVVGTIAPVGIPAPVGVEVVEEGRTIVFAGHEYVRNQPQVPDDESWETVHRLLQRVQVAMPVAPDAASEAAYLAVEESLTVVRTRAEAEVRASRPAMNLEEAVVAAGGQPIPAMDATGADDLMIRGLYRMFDRMPDGRHFRRVIDSNGRLRRRFMEQDQWNSELTLELERQRRGL
jgi:ParB/RepB/Spo0J family partition protein